MSAVLNTPYNNISGKNVLGAIHFDLIEVQSRIAAVCNVAMHTLKKGCRILI